MAKTNAAYADFTRGKLYTVNPFDVRIVGGLKLPEAERGPLDTDDGPEHPDVPADLLAPLDPGTLASIRKHGVIKAIVIASVDGVAQVVDGRTAIRAARIVFREREASGDPQIKVPATARPAADVEDRLGVQLATNYVRKEFTPLDRLRDARKVIASGTPQDEAAALVGLSPAKLADLIAIQEATAPVRDAVNHGHLSISAGRKLAAIRDPEKQREEAVKMLAGGKATVAAARKVAAAAAGKAPRPEMMKRVTVEDLLGRVAALEGEFGEGARAAIEMVLGVKTDERIAKLWSEA